MQFTPTSTQIASALAVVQSPQTCADNPQRRTIAWAALKTARGQTVNQTILGQMQRAQTMADLVLAQLAPAPPPMPAAARRIVGHRIGA